MKHYVGADTSLCMKYINNLTQSAASTGGEVTDKGLLGGFLGCCFLVQILVK
jgi:hypothetical protein